MKRLFSAALLAGVMAVGLRCGGDGPTVSDRAAESPADLANRDLTPPSYSRSPVRRADEPVPGAGLGLFQQPLGGRLRDRAGRPAHTGATILPISVPDSARSANTAARSPGWLCRTNALRSFQEATRSR